MIKQLHVPELGIDVVLARRKGTRSIRLSVKSDGVVRLSVPYGVSESQALKFLREKSDWVEKHLTKPRELQHDNHIGKSHRLVFVTSVVDNVRTRIRKNEVVVNVPAGMSIEDPSVQQAARMAATRALKKEAETLLPQRLETLAATHGINYRSLTVKKLRSRWGSCDSRKNIVLNVYLMQLPWHLIDYVILHELTHTYHPHHQAEFWAFLSSLEPNWKVLRKELKSKPTDILATNF